MVHRIIEFFLSIPAPLAILTVFLLTAGETAFLLGLVLPGELAAIVGGAIASGSRVPLAGILAAGILGPAAGDSIGYFLGRRYGRRYFTGKRRKNWARARQWLRKRGARAVFFGRFTPFLRSIIPPAAGVARLAYGRFLPWSFAAAILWGAGSVLSGYAIGRNSERLSRFSQRFSLGILALVVVLAGLYFLRQRPGRRRRARRRRRGAMRRAVPVSSARQ
ncbi:MAG TPA: DedA family protein [Thermoanaerobaculia bacterium]|jgi:undecaprenyl-diphosphatase